MWEDKERNIKNKYFLCGLGNSVFLRLKEEEELQMFHLNTLCNKKQNL